jgi:hypothetical protein
VDCDHTELQQKSYKRTDKPNVQWINATLQKYARGPAAVQWLAKLASLVLASIFRGQSQVYNRICPTLAIVSH